MKFLAWKKSKVNKYRKENLESFGILFFIQKSMMNLCIINANVNKIKKLVSFHTSESPFPPDDSVEDITLFNLLKIQALITIMERKKIIT